MLHYSMLKIEEAFKKIAKKNVNERRNCINNAGDEVLNDIRTVSKAACNNQKLRKNNKLKKYKKLKKVIRLLANSKTLKAVKRVLLKYNVQFGKGIFTLLGGLIIPEVVKLIAENV